jgi:hypothetical protein
VDDHRRRVAAKPARDTEDARLFFDEQRDLLEVVEIPNPEAEALSRIGELYACETRIREQALTGKAKCDYRLTYAKPVVDAFFELWAALCAEARGDAPAVVDGYLGREFGDRDTVLDTWRGEAASVASGAVSPEQAEHLANIVLACALVPVGRFLDIQEKLDRQLRPPCANCGSSNATAWK